MNSRMTVHHCLTALICAGMIGTVQASGKAHWGYEGHEGPAHWAELTKDYHQCMAGKQQSPIDITGALPADLPAIGFSYSNSSLDIVNNGHTIQVNVNGGSHIKVGGKDYKLLQFHFHSPSEHAVNGKHGDMVVHLVHQAEDGQLGVIGVMLNEGETRNALLDTLWQHLPRQSGDHKQAHIEINTGNLLPAEHAYFNYSGSLTTPPCSEGVNWMVMQQPVSVSADQVAAFTKLFKHSVRPLQPLNGRLINAAK